MAENPLEPDPTRERRIRERAYHLWEQEGRPHGRDREFWERARELIAIEDNPGAAQLPNPETHPEASRETGVEEAEIQENLGEFPDRFTDQGEVQQSPAAARSPRKRKAPAAPAKRASKPRSRKT